MEQVQLTEWFFEVGHVVNLAVIKAHVYAGYSIGLKNLLAATHFSQRPYWWIALIGEKWLQNLISANIFENYDLAALLGMSDQ